MAKEQKELQHAKAMNDEAVARIQAEAQTVTEKSAETWFETGKKIKFLDGKEYELKPVKLGHAHRLMQLLGSISIDIIILNFLDTGNPEADQKRIDNFFEALQLALSHYPEITKEYLDENCDVEIAKQILEYTIGLNRLVKN